ncbi:ABC transporter permease [Luedemannella flava]
MVLGRDAGAPVGATVQVLTGAGPAPYTVTGLIDGPGVYLPDATAARLALGVRLIGLLVDGPADEVAMAAAAVAGDGRVLTGEARRDAEAEAYARLRWIGAQILIAVGTLAVFVSVFIVASTFAFTATQRRRELALLRAVGATPGQVRRLLGAEALGVGLVASAVGVALGALAAPWAGDALVRAGLEPVGFTVVADVAALVAAYLGGVVVALVAVWAVARRAARVRPVAALREATVERRPMTWSRWLVGGALTVGGLALVVGSAFAEPENLMNTSLYAAMALILGLAALAPVVVGPLVRVLTWPFTLGRGATGTLVRGSAALAVRRTAGTAAPVLLTVGFATLILGFAATMTAAYGVGEKERTGAGVMVRPDTVPGLSDAAARAAGGPAPLPSVVYDASRGAVDVTGIDAVWRGDLLTATSGSLARLGTDPRGVAVVGWLDWAVGSTHELTLADGARETVTVLAVVEAAPTPVIMSRATVRAHDPSALAPVAYVLDGTAATTQARLGGGLGARAVDLTADSGGSDAEEDRLVQIFVWILVAVATGYTGLSIATTLLMAVVGRARDLALLRLAGASATRVRGLVAAESALVVAVGTVLGLAVALSSLAGLRAGLSASIGAPVDLIVPWASVAAVVGCCLALAIGAGTLSAHLALRTPAVRSSE